MSLGTIWSRCQFAKASLQLQARISGQRFLLSSTKEISALLLRAPPSAVSGFPLVLQVRSSPGPNLGGFEMPPIHGHEEGASHSTCVQTHRHCLFTSRNVAACKWSCRSLSTASARLADMMNLFLFLLWSLTSSPRPPGSLLCGRQDHVLFRPCEMQLEAPPQPAGAEVKRRERGRKGPPRWPAVCWLWSPGPSFVSPLRGL